MGSICSLRAQGFRQFLTENERTGSFPERAEPRDDIRGNAYKTTTVPKVSVWETYFSSGFHILSP